MVINDAGDNHDGEDGDYAGIRVVMMIVVMTNDNDGDHDKYLG